MKKIKLIFCLMLVVISLGAIFIDSDANSENQNYIESKDYISLSANKDNSKEIEDFLQLCQKENKDAFFNSGTYILKNSIKLVSNVSILGDELTIFKGQNINSNYQINIFDDLDTKNIVIKNIIFDNVTIYSQNANSTGWSIENNVFLNAKRVDVNIDSGLKPDANNKNGGALTGYYILKSKTNGNISSNIFLRDENSKGRGIGLYNTYDFIVDDNYFGILEDLDNSIVSLEVKALKNKILNLPSYDESTNQGYFMTCINVISDDDNTLIQGNHFSLNKDIEEANYEDGSGNSSGYHRDHIIYAKEYNNLKIVGNYFKGQNKNQDGGVKIRNGNDVLVYKNVFEDTLLLLYVQDYSRNYNLTNTYVAENKFINKDYTKNSVIINPGNIVKYPTQSFLIYIHNYRTDANISNLTIENNEIISTGLANETIRIVRKTGDNIPQNINIINNNNYLGNTLKITNDYGISESGNKYVCDDLNDYQNINIDSLYYFKEVDFKIENQKIVSSSQLYLNNKKYNSDNLTMNTKYELFSMNQEEISIVIEQNIYQLPSFNYKLSNFEIKSNLIVEAKVYDEIDLSSYIDFSIYKDFTVKNYNITDFTIEQNSDTIILRPKSVGNKIIVLNCGGFDVQINLNISDGIIKDFTATDLIVNQGDITKIVIDYDNQCRVNFKYFYVKDYLNIDEEGNVTGIISGIHSVLIKEEYSNLKKYIKIKVNSYSNVYLTKIIGKGQSINVLEDFELSNDLTFNYDESKISFINNIITINSLGNYQFVIFDNEKRLLISYNIIVKNNTTEYIEVENQTINLGNKVNLGIIFSPDVEVDFEFIYNDEVILIDEESLTVTGLKVGSHGLTIVEKNSNIIKNIIINVVDD